MRYSTREIAVVLEVCSAALFEIGLNHEGLFRISGNAAKVKRLKAGLDAGEIDLTDYDKDPHAIAGRITAMFVKCLDCFEPATTFQVC